MIDHVAIVGAGFSGTLQAINLHRHGGPRATLIERRATGQGLAFGAAHPSHVLNVRASNMSALPDDPDHFVRWLERRQVPDAAHAFVPRLTYGAYLRELLDEAVRNAGDRLRLVEGSVADIAWNGKARLRLEDGQSLAADAVALAVGNLPPHSPPGFDPEALSPQLYVADPWDGGLAAGLRKTDTALILGTGLTMVDVALLLESSGFEGRIVAISRRGLLPHVHADPGPPHARISERPLGGASALVRTVRHRADAIGWRAAVDELRRFTQDMWRAASDEERRRFLRHLRPWWDVHRHRLAPEVAARIDAMRRRGQLEIVAGKPTALTQLEGGLDISWRRRGRRESERLLVQRAINCTGPQGDLMRTRDPLLLRLMERGLIRPDAARIGIEVDMQARTVAADGTSNDWLYALGPMTRGAFWEIVAVPDIRSQTWDVARRLSNAQWVGGEGL